MNGWFTGIVFVLQTELHVVQRVFLEHLAIVLTLQPNVVRRRLQHTRRHLAAAA
jgi:hypothetical protein